MAKLRKGLSDLSHIADAAQQMAFAEGNQSGFRIGGAELDLEEVKVVLESAIEFHPDVSQVDRIGIISKALFAVAKNGTVDHSTLWNSICQHEAQHIKKNRDDYVLLTTFAIPDFDDYRTLSHLGARITTARHPPRRLREPRFRNKPSTLWRELRELEKSSCWVWVTIKVDGRTPYDAAENGINRAENLRAIWNLLLNRLTRSSRSSGKLPPPANCITRGPITTIHQMDGELGTDAFWYQLPHRSIRSERKVKKNWVYVKKNTTTVSRLLRRSPLKDDLLRLLRQYNSALDSCDYSVARNELWSVLERLTGAGSNHEKVVPRVAFLYENRDLHRVVLEHLRRLRNRSIHDGDDSNDEETCLYQLKRYVEHLFEFLLKSGSEFSSFQDAGEFLDLPYETSILKKRMESIRRAIKFRS